MGIAEGGQNEQNTAKLGLPARLWLVVDEVHTYKGQSTGAGYAPGKLVSLAGRALLMTGTLFGGQASSAFTAFTVSQRTSPTFRRRFRFTELQRFVERSSPSSSPLPSSPACPTWVHTCCSAYS